VRHSDRVLVIDRRPTGAGRAALRAFHSLPVSARVHATVRWWSAPLPRIEAALPPAGRVLEIGCGHGLFSAFAALSGTAGSRSVVGVDIDADKIALARRMAANLPGIDLSFRVAESGAVPAGPWDAIVIVDVLYLLPAPAQRALLAEAAAHLAPGGVLLIKEMSPTPRWKAAWNRWQETLAVSVLGITERAADDGAAAAEPFSFVDPATMAGWLRDEGLWTAQQRLDRHRLHPHHLLLARRGDQGPA
jgi:SAM-dependent methyltransferase